MTGQHSSRSPRMTARHTRRLHDEKLVGVKRVPDSGNDHLAMFDQTINNKWFVVVFFHRSVMRSGFWQGAV